MKGHRRLLWAAVPLTAFVVVAASCGSGSKPPAADNSPSGASTTASGLPSDAAPDAEQVLTIREGAEPNSVDPQAVSYDYENSVTTNLFLRLFDQDPKSSALTPLAAAEVPTQENGGISADGTVITVELKASLTWSDGSPLTASDFVYGIIRGFDLRTSGSGYGGFITQINGAAEASKLDPGSPTYGLDVQNLLKDNVVAVDPTTIRIALTGPSASFLYCLSLPITAAVKQSNVEELGERFGQANGAADMVTSGPFKVKEWAAKDHITVVRNDKYTAGHKAYLSQVTFKFIEDSNQSYNAYLAGQVDESIVPSAVFHSVSQDASMKGQLYQEEEFGTRSIVVDVTVDPWTNKDFVIGINQATDREAIARDVYQGLRKPWVALCAPAVLACDPSKFSNLQFNLDSARASIGKAYPDGDIPIITLEVVSDPTTMALAVTLQSQWKQVGVSTNIVTTDQTTLRADMREHRSGTQITGWGMDFADPTDLWSIKTTAQVGAANFSYYSRPEYDRLVAEQDKTLDQEKRKQLLAQIQDFYASDPADITFSIQLRTDVFKPYVKGLVSSPFNYHVYGDQFLADVYIAEH